MRILLVSDTHGNNEILFDLYKTYPNMDLYLHAGDSLAYNQSLLSPFISVNGNCDYYQEFPESFEIKTEFGWLLMKHKPYLTERDKKHNLRIFVHGHTHIPECEERDEIIHICPGSISSSRRGKESYMILDINEKSLTLTLYELENKNVLYTREFL